MNTVELLKELGLTKAAEVLCEKTERNRKLHLAYQNFKFVTKEQVEKFNKELKEKTEVIYDKNTKEVRKKIDPSKYNEVVYDKLVSYKLSDYASVPPQEALEELRKAQEIGCFDGYEVAKVESIVEVIDPIIFGRINGCSDLFFIAQWDNDVKLDDLINNRSK